MAGANSALVVGVDVSATRGLDVVVLDEHSKVVAAHARLAEQDLATLLDLHRPAVVAIDSPPGPGTVPGASARECELQLRALGVQVFLTPADPERFTGRFYDWVRVGMRAFAVATAAGYPVVDDPRHVRGRALEVYPHASDVCLRGHLPPAGTTASPHRKRDWRLATLHLAGVRTDDLCRDARGQPTADSVDAALAALTARRAADGCFAALGGRDGWIVVPGAPPSQPFRRG